LRADVPHSRGGAAAAGAPRRGCLGDGEEASPQWCAGPNRGVLARSEEVPCRRWRSAGRRMRWPLPDQPCRRRLPAPRWAVGRGQSGLGAGQVGIVGSAHRFTPARRGYLHSTGPWTARRSPMESPPNGVARSVPRPRTTEVAAGPGDGPDGPGRQTRPARRSRGEALAPLRERPCVSVGLEVGQFVRPTPCQADVAPMSAKPECRPPGPLSAVQACDHPRRPTWGDR